MCLGLDMENGMVDPQMCFEKGGGEGTVEIFLFFSSHFFFSITAHLGYNGIPDDVENR